MQQRDATPAARSEATHPTRGVFRREGEYWTLDYGGTTRRLQGTVPGPPADRRRQVLRVRFSRRWLSAKSP
jgi:hypothetical protein